MSRLAGETFGTSMDFTGWIEINGLIIHAFSAGADEKNAFDSVRLMQLTV